MTQAETTPAPASEAPTAPTAPPPRRLGMLKVGGAVLAVMALELVAAYLYWPSSGQVAAQADAAIKAEVAHPAESHEEPHGEPIEVSLGQAFRVTNLTLVNTVLRIDFELYGLIAPEEAEEFAELLEKNKNRLRDEVIVTIRSADRDDLTDAGLGLIKRKILATTNRTLGKPLLQGVIFSDFSVVEQ